MAAIASWIHPLYLRLVTLAFTIKALKVATNSRQLPFLNPHCFDLKGFSFKICVFLDFGWKPRTIFLSLLCWKKLKLIFYEISALLIEINQNVLLKCVFLMSNWFCKNLTYKIHWFLKMWFNLRNFGSIYFRIIVNMSKNVNSF